MSKYRDGLRIVADILFIARKRAKKTQIMYQANLSYKLLCRYMVKVVDAGLIAIEGEDYVLTTKGEEFLCRHEEYSKGCKSLEEYFNYVNNEKMILEKMCFNAGHVDNKVNRTYRNREVKKTMM